VTRIKPKTERRERIIEAALKIFAKKDFQDATISEISKAAGVSDATVYEYFKSKEELLFKIPEEITETSIEAIEKFLPYVRGAEAKMRVIIQNYISTYERNPEYSNLIMLHLKNNRKFLKTKAYEVVRTAAQSLLLSIQEGIEDGTFKKDADPYLVRAMILGTIEHLFTRKHLLGKPSNLMEYVDPIVDLVLSGISTQKDQKNISLHLHLSGDTLLPEKTATHPGEQTK
jgi:TetR/AcrR family fatty acid metabolism transcriptional regulator